MIARTEGNVQKMTNALKEKENLLKVRTGVYEEKLFVTKM